MEHLDVVEGEGWQRIRPAWLVVLTFAALIVFGIVTLQFLIHTGPTANSEVLTSAFTSVSAVCVTGLTVIDLSRDVGFGGHRAS